MVYETDEDEDVQDEVTTKVTEIF